MNKQCCTYSTEAEWLALRRKDVTSTQVAALFGLAKYKQSKFKLWHEKLMGLEPEFETNERMKWGSRLEAPIAHGIAEDLGLTAEKYSPYWRCPDLRLGASFDYKLSDGRLLEIKKVDEHIFNKEFTDTDLPDHIELQVQQELLVSEFTDVLVGVMVGGNYCVTYDRSINTSVHNLIVEESQKFWALVDAKEEPEPDFDNEADAVIAYHQRAKDLSKVIRDDDLDLLVRQYVKLGELKRNSEKKIESLKAQILHKIGDDCNKVLGQNWSVSCGMTKENEGQIITPDMVGTRLGGRKPYRNFRVNIKKEKV